MRECQLSFERGGAGVNDFILTLGLGSSSPLGCGSYGIF